MTEYKWGVGIRHKTTKEKLTIIVWATTNDETTHQLIGTFIGYDREYDWTGIGPIYEHNQHVKREVKKPFHGPQIASEQSISRRKLSK